MLRHVDADAPPLVAIAASAGGIGVLGRVLGALPQRFPAAVLVVVHLEPHRASQLATVLGRMTALPVAQARGGELPLPGHVYVAPPDRHLRVSREGTLELGEGPAEHHTRPAADPLFASLAPHAGRGVAAVVLSGMGSDGSGGVPAVHAAGGTVLAQEPGTAAYAAMPAAAIATGCVDRVLAPERLAPFLVTLFSDAAE